MSPLVWCTSWVTELFYQSVLPFYSIVIIALLSVSTSSLFYYFTILSHEEATIWRIQNPENVFILQHLAMKAVVIISEYVSVTIYNTRNSTIYCFQRGFSKLCDRLSLALPISLLQHSWLKIWIFILLLVKTLNISWKILIKKKIRNNRFIPYK